MILQTSYVDQLKTLLMLIGTVDLARSQTCSSIEQVCGEYRKFLTSLGQRDIKSTSCEISFITREDETAQLRRHFSNDSLLRSKKLDTKLYVELAQKVLEVCRQRGAELILNGPLSDLDCVDADGVHLDSHRLLRSNTRPLGSGKLVSASCHSQEELLHAERIGVDFVTLSPVLPTQTHPNATPIGWERFFELTRSAGIPVYALGGMSRTDVSVAKSFGACGIAAIRSLWMASDDQEAS